MRAHLKRIFEQACAGGDLEGAAVIHRSADDDDGGAPRLPIAMNAQLGTTVTHQLAKPLGPVGCHARTSLQSFVNAVDDCAVGSRASHGEKIPALLGNVSRMISVSGYRQSHSDAPHQTICNQTSRVRNVPRNSELF